MAGGMMDRSGAQARRGSRRRIRPMSEINVTPFVDVMLVLLVIFMVAAPLLTVGVPVELPETAARPLEQEDEEPLTITLAADGSVSVQEEPIEQGRLVNLLRAIVAERSTDKVFIRADGAVPYAQVMVIMGALNAAGFRDIGLVTEGGGPTLTDEN